MGKYKDKNDKKRTPQPEYGVSLVRGRDGRPIVKCLRCGELERCRIVWPCKGLCDECASLKTHLSRK